MLIIYIAANDRLSVKTYTWYNLWV